MNNRTQISVIVPVYNSEDTLSRCLESLTNQTFKDFEVILINDGSNDNSINICEQYIRKDSRITLINTENEGVSSARNKGLKKSKGKYIMFCDSDDWIEENTLELLYNSIEKNNSDVVFSGFYGDLFLNNRIYKSVTESISSDISCNVKELNNIFIYLFNTSRTAMQSPWAKLFKRDIIENNDLLFNTDMICYEDFEFNLKYLTQCESIVFLKNTMYHYVNKYNQSALERRKKDNLVYEISYTYEAFMKFLDYIDADSDLRKYIYEYFYEAFLLPIQKLADSKNKLCYNRQKEIMDILVNNKAFIDLNKNIDKKFYKILTKLINYKCYRLSIFFIKKRLNIV